jgi:hypothetical protein
MFPPPRISTFGGNRWMSLQVEAFVADALRECSAPLRRCQTYLTIQP